MADCPVPMVTEINQSVSIEHTNTLKIRNPVGVRSLLFRAWHVGGDNGHK